MPEEINRLVTDRLSAFLFTPSRDGDANLAAEGVSATSIHFVGNVMIDTLQRLLPIADGEAPLRTLNLVNGHGPSPFILVTLHRPSNVDDPDSLARLMAALETIATRVPRIFPLHPRTRASLERFGIPQQRTKL